MAELASPDLAAAEAGRADRLQALRQAGAARVDPVQLHFLDVLALRIAVAPAAQQRVLQVRWEAACVALERACAAAASPSAEPAVAAAPRGVAALAALNLHARAASGQARGPEVLPPGDTDAGELRSLRGFRDSWSRIAAVDTVNAAVTRGPENAGPLNSHSLVLRSLALMRALSPDYLRRFLSQAETLRLLEDAAQSLHAPAEAGPAKPARATRAGKAAKTVKTSSTRQRG